MKLHTHAGLLTLPAVLILLTVASLAILSAAQPLVVEMRSSSDHLLTMQAQHSAEAGQAWALSTLNAPAEAGAACSASPLTPATLWRDQVLLAPEGAATSATEAIRPLGTLTSCSRTESEWHCKCLPETSGSTKSSTTNDTAQIARLSRFDLTWKAGPTSWTASLLSRACEGSACREGFEGGAVTGHAAVRQSFSRLGAWRHPPTAVLSAGARIRLSSGVHVVLRDTSDAAPVHPRWALSAGQGLSMESETVIGPPGTSPDLLLQPAAMGSPSSVDNVLRHLLDLPLAWWSRLPTVAAVSCPSSGCTADDLQPALARGTAGIAIHGDLRLEANGTGLDPGAALSIGSTNHPILLAVQGRASIRTRLHLQGLLVAKEIDWSSPGPSSLTGAATSVGALTLSGPIDVQHDAPTLAHLARTVPAWVPVAGTWEDVTDE